MKYTPEQKSKAVYKNISLSRKQQLIREKVKQQFPVNVEIKDGFYIVESKINKL